MSVVDELVEANGHFAETFDKGELPHAPARHVAIVTCMAPDSTPRSSWAWRSETPT